MNAYANWTAKRIAVEYRNAYVAHHALAQAYADGNADAADLGASFRTLKALRAAYAAEVEANQVRAH